MNDVEVFKGQFIYTRELTPPPQFETVRFGDYFLHHDPHLPIAIHDKGILLGHALDWRFPEKTYADILADLTQGAFNDAAMHSNRLSGRWALILPGPVVIGDGGGTLSIVWNENSIGSSAALLAYCNPTLKRKRRPDYEAHRLNGWHSGFAFFATDTEIEGVKALLPNHVLDKGTVRRFYPTARLPKRTITDSAPRMGQIMRGSLAAAANRAPLAIGLTSGYDSRLIAAAAPETGAVFFTMQDGHACPEGHADIEGAKTIAGLLGMQHAVHVATGSESLRINARQSEAMQAERFEDWAAVSQDFKRICISGWASEVGRDYMAWPGSEYAELRDILNCAGVHRFSELHGEAQVWLGEAKDVSTRFGIKVIDLLYWELRVGRWISAAFNILNQGEWWMTPYTCREMFEAMLAVPSKERGYHGRRLYLAAIGHMNPELAKLPVTPLALRERLTLLRSHHLSRAVARALDTLGLLRRLRRLRARA